MQTKMHIMSTTFFFMFRATASHTKKYANAIIKIFQYEVKNGLTSIRMTLFLQILKINRKSIRQFIKNKLLQYTHHP